MEKPIYNVVSLSGGKDSTAMLLGMLERGMQIDCILFCDTGLEFPAMYEHLNKLEKDIGRSITRIKAEKSFEYLMLEVPIKRKKTSLAVQKHGSDIMGKSWAFSRMRWCTSALKWRPKNKFLQELNKRYQVIEYVGIAYDEQYRLERKNNQNPNHRHPLADWNMTEEDCLRYCYEHGYDWDGLYEHFSHVSCWCCPLQSLEELRQLHRYYPDLWEKLKDWDNRTWRKFRGNYTVEELERRFAFEEEWTSSGNTYGTKAFYAALKERLHSNNGTE